MKRTPTLQSTPSAHAIWHYRLWMAALALAALSGISGPGILAQSSQIQMPAKETNLPPDPVATGYRQHFPAAENRGSAALWQVLKKLNTRASLMNIVAHPDDEDGGMMALASRGAGARVALFTLTRGEGGQNIMSGDLWDQLGLVRTQELLAADDYYGASQYWGSVVDFGFSKTREEALQQWGHERVLYDVVRAVRQFRPLVVTSTFVGGVTDGHGQHQVAGELAQEVFEAAGDPTVFPDQITKLGLQPWQPLKVYEHIPFAQVTDKGIYDYATQTWTPVRFYNYITKQWTDGVPATNVTVHEGQYDAVLGETYAQVAAQGLGQQRSQHSGPDVPGIAPRDSNYHRYASRVAAKDMEQSLFDGIDTSLAGLATLAPPAAGTAFLKDGLARIQKQIDQAIRLYAPSTPSKTAPALVEGLRQTNSLLAELDKNSQVDPRGDIRQELTVKAGMFQDALILALGVNLQATAVPGKRSESIDSVIPGEQVQVAVHSATPLPASGAPLVTGCTNYVSPKAAANESATSCTLTIADDAMLTRPRFSRPNIEQAYYDLDLKNPRNWSWALTQDGMKPAATASATFLYEGQPITLQVPVMAAHDVTGQGTLYEPLSVLPAISITVSPAAGAVPLAGGALHLTALLHSNVQGPADGSVQLKLPSGWTSTPAEIKFHIATAGEEQNTVFTVQPAHLEAKPYNITAVASYDGHTYTSGYTTVGYPGLRRAYYFRPSSFHAVGVDVKVAPGLKVGYVMGTGDEVPQSLDFLGVHTQLLSAQDLASGDLTGYDAIVLGVRAYAARPELAVTTSRLLDYARQGGTVIVQYNTNEYDHNFGPYPYSFGGRPENVVDESDKVEILQPQNPLLNWPNKITSQDFNGWVEERGHSFMRQWDPRYQALTETHDPGQNTQQGGLLYAHYGRGAYVYVAYALYRQLPEGVPGAYRIFANLLSLRKNPEIDEIKATDGVMNGNASR